MGGVNISASGYIRGYQPHGTNNSNHNTQHGKKIEDETLLWYLVNAIVNPETG